ncbi:MAG: hypothetical protein GC136_02085 [Alphaproteobacteria bacterium]|nr:hypothetical protein [Alphaproteobacteria bacterium]
MASHALITRIDEANETLAAGLQAKGWQPVTAPLFNIIQTGPQTIDAQQYRRIIITSPHAVPAQIITGADFYVVGERAQKALAKIGATTEVKAFPTIDALLANLAQEPATPILYLRGAHVKKDLKTALDNLDEITLYEARPRETLPEDIKTMLAKKSIKLVTLHSPRSAAIFMGLVADYTLDEVVFLCMSEDIAKELPRTARIIAAVQPNVTGLLNVCPKANS